MKERIAELRLKLLECSATIKELADAGANITLTVETLKVAKGLACDNTTSITISATIQTEI